MKNRTRKGEEKDEDENCRKGLLPDK